MTSLVNRAVSALRSWLGLPAAPRRDRPMTPSHGWLLPPPAVLRARKAAARLGATNAGRDE